MKQFNFVVCGGTFDHFHKGHGTFLRYVFSVGKKILVGVTSDSYVKNSKSIHSASSGQNAEFIEPFEKRKQTVLEFVKKEKVLNKVKIIKIDDLFGPTLAKDLLIDAIVISEDTKKGADIINQKRKELGLGPLKVFVAPSVKAEDRKLISSARIRGGAISRVGKPYVKSSWLKTDLVLPESLRGEFQKPFGELLLDISGLSKNKNNLIITVGDVTTKTFNERSLKQNLSVIDFRVAREKKFVNIEELDFTGDEVIFNADNPAGFITANLFKKLAEIFQSGIKEKTILQVNGEEDLAVLPLVLLAPLNTIIYYGQPHKGLVRVAVSEETKNKAYNLVLKLKQA